VTTTTRTATCTIEGCTRPVDARGWCKSHYGGWRRHGDPLAVEVGKPAPIGDLVENVEFLLSVREHPENIARRQGYTMAALARRLARHGRADLSAHFDRDRSETRRAR